EDVKYSANGTMVEFESSGLWKVVRRVDLMGYASFSINADILLGKLPDENHKYENSIDNCLLGMHKLGFANVRLDYVAHSMGGAIGRDRINNGGEWYRPGVLKKGQRKGIRNYGGGLINKYISICTPHNGSHWADLLVESEIMDLNFLEKQVYRFGTWIIFSDE